MREIKLLQANSSLSFVIAVNGNLQRLFINGKIEDVGTATHLAILDVGLGHSLTEIDEGEVDLAANGALIFSGGLHSAQHRCNGSTVARFAIAPVLV